MSKKIVPPKVSRRWNITIKLKTNYYKAECCATKAYAFGSKTDNLQELSSQSYPFQI